MQKQSPRRYQIQIDGHLDQSWSTWFEGLAITYPDTQTTILSGQVQDQGQLHMILIKIRDLNLILVSVNPVQNAQAEERRSPFDE